ncbi:MAG: hypothetical protein M3N95_10490 [Actinomycetota bacterium]|nr:hypothetical protein [Actinomycetota bacterium]
MIRDRNWVAVRLVDPTGTVLSAWRMPASWPCVPSERYEVGGQGWTTVSTTWQNGWTTGEIWTIRARRAEGSIPSQARVCPGPDRSLPPP